jgi:hypothetical protein
LSEDYIFFFFTLVQDVSGQNIIELEDESDEDKNEESGYVATAVRALYEQKQIENEVAKLEVLRKKKEEEEKEEENNNNVEEKKQKEGKKKENAFEDSKTTTVTTTSKLTSDPKTIITAINISRLNGMANKAFVLPSPEVPESFPMESVPANQRVLKAVKVADPPVSAKVWMMIGKSDYA